VTFPDPSKERPIAGETPVQMLRRALDHLKRARTLCRRAKAPKAYERCRAAISSAEGAKRHAETTAAE